MSNIKEENQEQKPKLVSKEFLEETLKRLRLQLTRDQDRMDCTAHCIKSIEWDLSKVEEEEIEKNAKAE